MKLNLSNAVVLPGAVLALLGGLLMFSACDTTESDTSLVITPASADLAGSGASVRLKASFPGGEVISGVNTNTNLDGLFLPLEWTVVNPDLGQIVGESGDSAVYVSYGALGENVVIVKDQQNKEGLASMHQVPLSDSRSTTTATASP